MGIEGKVRRSRCCQCVSLISLVHPLAWQVGHVTCDNASNNVTMMKELAVRLNTTTGKVYDGKVRKIKSVILL